MNHNYPTESCHNQAQSLCLFDLFLCHFRLVSTMALRNYLIYLAPQFSMMSLLPLTEVLRKANELSDTLLYSYEFVSAGPEVKAVNGMSIKTRAQLLKNDACTGVIVCASYQLQIRNDKSLHGWLRWNARHGVPIGVTDTGAFIAAQAGLDWNVPICVHWQSRAAFHERHPDMATSEKLFEYTPQRFSCIGAAAGLDLMLHILAEHHGPDFAAQVGSHLVFGHQNDRMLSRKSNLAEFIGQVTDPRLEHVLLAMEQSSGPRRSMPEFAAEAGLTVGQLNRLFKKHFSKTPARVFQLSRLRRAQGLIRTTAMPIEAIAEACGFASRSQFAHSYKAEFGLSPGQVRGTWDQKR